MNTAAASLSTSTGMNLWADQVEREELNSIMGGYVVPEIVVDDTPCTDYPSTPMAVRTQGVIHIEEFIVPEIVVDNTP